MTNHQNRSSRAGPSSNPTPASIRALRERANLTPADAAAMIHASARAWQQWESGDRRMHPAFWELFRIKLAWRNGP